VERVQFITFYGRTENEKPLRQHSEKLHDQTTDETEITNMRKGETVFSDFVLITTSLLSLA
jgi:hypothetical protein